jgi:hypothetical protein
MGWFAKLEDGKIVGGLFRNAQPGKADEYFEDDHPAVVAFLNPPEPVPQTVSMAQARLALIGAGLFSAIDAGLKALPEPQRTTALTAWEYAPNVSRNGALVTTLGGQFGLTEKQLDDLFTAAAAIEL